MESIFWYTDITKERSNHCDLETHRHKLRARAYHHQQLLSWRANDPGNGKTVLSDFLARHRIATDTPPSFLFDARSSVPRCPDRGTILVNVLVRFDDVGGYEEDYCVVSARSKDHLLSRAFQPSLEQLLEPLRCSFHFTRYFQQRYKARHSLSLTDCIYLISENIYVLIHL